LSERLLWGCLVTGGGLIIAALIPLVVAVFVDSRLGAALLFLAALVAAVAGLQLAAIGIVGLHLSRALERATGRSLFPIEASTSPLRGASNAAERHERSAM